MLTNRKIFNFNFETLILPLRLLVHFLQYNDKLVNIKNFFSLNAYLHLNCENTVNTTSIRYYYSHLTNKC